jgi:hypothetical protein
MPVHKTVTPRSCLSKISDAICNCQSSCLKNDHFCTHTDFPCFCGLLSSSSPLLVHYAKWRNVQAEAKSCLYISQNGVMYKQLFTSACTLRHFAICVCEECLFFCNCRNFSSIFFSIHVSFSQLGVDQNVFQAALLLCSFVYLITYNLKPMVYKILFSVLRIVLEEYIYFW